MVTGFRRGEKAVAVAGNFVRYPIKTVRGLNRRQGLGGLVAGKPPRQHMTWIGCGGCFGSPAWLAGTPSVSVRVSQITAQKALHWA